MKPKELSTLKDSEIKLSLYFTMVKIRRVEERIAINYSKGLMRCPIHLSIGQEAVPAALSFCITNKDIAVSTHRCHAHYLAKGGNLKKMIAELYGKETGCSKGKGGSMHLIDKDAGFMGSSAIVGNSIPIGTGVGLSLKLSNSDNISIVYLGEGATEEGVFYESLNFACLKKLNVLFVCENNLYSVYSPLKVRQPSNRSSLKIAEGMGVTRAEKINGDDPMKILTSFKQNIKSMKEKAGPTFLEFSTYRWREHCGPNFDNDIGYRSEEEFKEWKKRDPIETLRKELQQIIPDFIERETTFFSEIDLKINNAFIFAESSSFPKQEDAFQNIYAKET